MTKTIVMYRVSQVVLFVHALCHPSPSCFALGFLSYSCYRLWRVEAKHEVSVLSLGPVALCTPQKKVAVYHRDGFFATNLTKPRTTCLPLAAARYLEACQRENHTSQSPHLRLVYSGDRSHQMAARNNSAKFIFIVKFTITRNESPFHGRRQLHTHERSNHNLDAWTTRHLPST